MYQDGVLGKEFEKLKKDNPVKYAQLIELDHQETYWLHKNGHELVITNGKQAWHMDSWETAQYSFKDSNLINEKSIISAGYRRTDFLKAKLLADTKMIELKRPSVEGLEDYLFARRTAMEKKPNNKFKDVAKRMTEQLQNDPELQKRKAEWEAAQYDGQDVTAIAKENTRLSALEKYRQVYKQSLEMRTEFARKPGYVRQKGDDERAYHAAKASFGEFTPNDHDAMVANTNNGQGAQVNLADGTAVKIENQKQLYDKIVEYNKRYGAFYDEEHIRQTSEADHYRLHQTQKQLNEAKAAVVGSYQDKADAYKALSTIEQSMKGEKLTHSQSTKGQGANPQASTSADASMPPVSSASEPGQKTLNRPGVKKPASRPAKRANELTSNGDIDESRIREADKGLIDKFNVIKKRSQEHYYWKDSDRVAFADKGSKITTQSNSTVIAQSIVEVADSKGWTHLKVKGQDTFKRTVWFEASMRGIGVEGYKPSQQDLQELEQRLAKENAVEAVTIRRTEQPLSDTPSHSGGNTFKPVVVDDRAKENFRLINELKLNKNTQLAVQDHGKGLKKATILIKNGKTAEQFSYALDMQAKVAVPMAYHKSVNGKTVEHSQDLDQDQVKAAENSLRASPQAKHQANLAEKVEPQFQASSRKVKLKTAYLTMEKSAALASYPELKELYELEEAAKELAEKRIGNRESQTEYVTAIRERSLNELANGKRLPQFAHEGDASTTRAAGRQMDYAAER